MILKRLGLALALVAGTALLAALLIAPASAAAMEKGTTLLSVQLMHGDADFATPEVFDPGSITAYDHSEWGGQLMLQHMVSPKWALALSAAIGTFKETDEAGTNALPNTPDFVYSQSSFNGRFGFDRFVSIADDVSIYMGPGLQFWTGKGKFDDGSSPEIESESTTRIAMSGRIGANVALGTSVGLNGYMGCYIGKASADDQGAKASWTPSGSDGAVGVSFKF